MIKEVDSDDFSRKFRSAKLELDYNRIRKFLLAKGRKIAGKRTLSPEAELLLKARLLRYKRRNRRTSLEAVAGDLSAWSEIVRWYPNAFSPRAKPVFNGLMLQKWIKGDTSHGSRRATSPEGMRLTVVCEFLLSKNMLFDFEIQPDNVGYALARSIQNYAFNNDQIEINNWEGRYEGYTENEDALILHSLQVWRDTFEDILLFEYKNIRAMRRGEEGKTQLQARLLNDDPHLARALLKGWGAQIPEEQCICFLRRPGDPFDKPKPWIWSNVRIAHIPFVRLKSPGHHLYPAHGNDDVEGTHSLPIMKKLTYSDDITYHLNRKGGIDLSIVQNIMKSDRNKRTIGSLTDIDIEFLVAAGSFDPEPMLDALKRGANVNAIDPRTGLTALLNAASQGVSGTINILIEQKNLDPSVTDPHGRLASDLVVISLGDLDLIERLIDLETSYEETHSPSP